MPTVAILAELLIVGIQATVWCYLGVAIFFGIDWLDPALLQISESIATVILLALAYTLGVVVDRVSDSAYVNVSGTIQRLRGQNNENEPDYPGMRLRVLSKGGELAAYLGYMRSRLRVARSTVFNLVATLIVLLALAASRSASAGGLPPNVLVAAVAFCTVLLLASLWVTMRISATYDERLRQSDPGA